jgi:hypothetical protein
MRLTRNRPAQPPSATNQPNFDRAETAQRAAVPARGAACARQYDPASRDLHEGPGEKCGLRLFAATTVARRASQKFIRTRIEPPKVTITDERLTQIIQNAQLATSC